MKKLITLLLAAFTAFSLSAFAACEDEEKTSSPVNSSSSAISFFDESSGSESIPEEASSENSSSIKLESSSMEDSTPEVDQTAKKIQTFYDLVSLSKKALDIVAEDVYSYWYSSIYEDAYENDIDVAINAALADNSELISSINESDAFIVSLYKEIRDSELSAEIKAVMSVYLDYYDFAINVSGSFKDYKEKIDPLQKEFDDALKALFLEM